MNTLTERLSDILQSAEAYYWFDEFMTSRYGPGWEGREGLAVFELAVAFKFALDTRYGT